VHSALDTAGYSQVTGEDRFYFRELLLCKLVFGNACGVCLNKEFQIFFFFPVTCLLKSASYGQNQLFQQNN
jgi:hypothetical protein